jgi:hypothetical protein
LNKFSFARGGSISKTLAFGKNPNLARAPLSGLNVRKSYLKRWIRWIEWGIQGIQGSAPVLAFGIWNLTCLGVFMLLSSSMSTHTQYKTFAQLAAPKGKWNYLIYKLCVWIPSFAAYRNNICYGKG